jgi:hypothetical protein
VCDLTPLTAPPPHVLPPADASDDAVRSADAGSRDDIPSRIERTWEERKAEHERALNNADVPPADLEATTEELIKDSGVSS